MLSRDVRDVKLTEEISDALNENKAIVALESTIISHGMPYPRNVETAIAIETEVRNNGAIPATIAIVDGKLFAGLSLDQIEMLGVRGRAIPKCSRRDLPYIMSFGLHGATTVAATMIIAAKAGIRIFATGGIGGVHRGAGQTFDISADLRELAQTNVAVVSAGAKAILDIGLTLEYLETCGVPVLGFRTDRFPAFYSRDSGFSLDYRIDSARDVARIIHAKWTSDLHGGILIANPISEEHALEFHYIEGAIAQALLDADEQSVKGKEITPFLLASIEHLTEGRSLESNIQLVLRNARLAAEIAVEFSVMQLQIDAK